MVCREGGEEECEEECEEWPPVAPRSIMCLCLLLPGELEVEVEGEVCPSAAMDKEDDEEEDAPPDS